MMSFVCAEAYEATLVPLSDSQEEGYEVRRAARFSYLDSKYDE